MYYGSLSGGETVLDRQTTAGSTVVSVMLPPGLDDLTAMGNALYLTIETTTTPAKIGLGRFGPGASYIVSSLSTADSNDLVLAEGSTDVGLFAIHDDAELVVVSPGDGTLTRVAWSDDADWVWRAACAPRGGHRLAGDLIVLESNRTLDRDRLLVVSRP